MILILTSPLKAQQQGPSVTNKQAKVELKMERKRERERRKREKTEEKKDQKETDKLAKNKKFPKRKKKNIPKSTDIPPKP